MNRTLRTHHIHSGDLISRTVVVPGLVESGGAPVRVTITHIVDEVGPDWVRTHTHEPVAIDYWGNHPRALATLRDLRGEQTGSGLRAWPKKATSAAQILTSLTVHHGIPGWIHVPRTRPSSPFPDNAVLLNLPWAVDRGAAEGYVSTIREYQPYQDVVVRLTNHGADHYQVLIYPRKDPA